jgi:hypothetical protein
MIQSKQENIEQIRERIRKMSDAELRKFGRAAQDSQSISVKRNRNNDLCEIQAALQAGS